MPVDQTTLDAAIGPGIGDDLQANRKELAGLKAKRDTAVSDRAAAEDEAAKIQGQTAEAVNADRQKLADFKPRESAIPTPKAPDFSSNEPSPEQMQKTAGMLMVVAGLMGAFSRQGYTAALNNMSGALEGFQAGNAEATKKHLDEFHSQVTDFKTKLEALKEDRAALDKMDQHDIQGIQQQMEFDAHKNDLPLLAQTARSKSLTEGLKTYDSQIKEIEKAIDHSETLAQRLQDVYERHADRAATLAATQGSGGGEATPDARALYDELVRAGKNPPKTNRGNVDWQQLDYMAKHEQGGAGSGSVVAGQADYKSDASSLAVQQKRTDAVESSMRKIASDIKTIDSTMADGNAGFAKWLNQPLNSLRTQTSDPKLAAYALSVKQVATEYERAIQGGLLSAAQLHQGAAEEAKKILNENMSVEEVRAVIPIMIREMENARRAASDQLHEIRTRLHAPAPTASASQPPLSNAKGWKLHQDAKGNKAYVGPNGEVEEVH